MKIILYKGEDSKQMKKLLTIAMALLLLYAGCAQLASTPEGIPHDISAEPSPTANETEAPASGEPQQAHADALDEPDKTDAPAAPKAEVSDVVRYWLLKNYQEAAEVNDDVAGSITQFANYAGMKYKQSYDDYAKWNCMVLMNSEDHDHYAQYIYTGKWAKYGSIQIIGGALSADKKNIDGQIMVFGKKMGFEQMLDDKEFTQNFPLGFNLGGEISTWHIFAVTTVEIENWEYFAAQDTGYIPSEAYELLEAIEAMDDSERSAYYEQLAKEYSGNDISIISEDDILILCGYAMSLEGEMAVAYARKP